MAVTFRGDLHPDARSVGAVCRRRPADAAFLAQETDHVVTIDRQTINVNSSS
jgi:hypothetical protein